VEETCKCLFEAICSIDCAGIIAKPRVGFYRPDHRPSHWIKIRNPRYSQKEGREELFEPGSRKANRNARRRTPMRFPYLNILHTPACCRTAAQAFSAILLIFLREEWRV
jgi:hypothetical protein